ncbi:hypothetical protein XENOCAPTIV_011247 [Xenoophorus captivus]|uniref:PKD domain-containing protein n=1 Tax=Xenoophorus captivus TaxID=1517983 RepID=A0ABV0Q4W0_9TELE
MILGFILTVKELVVSAGESVEVTLPRNEVELNAFVVPPPPPGKTYLEAPHEHEAADCSACRASSCSHFEVTVDGEGAHGQGYVNVTVRPESTDDDKVVTWHWEEVKGPLREEKVSADTPVLTLTNLVPGNYTFRLNPGHPVCEQSQGLPACRQRRPKPGQKPSLSCLFWNGPQAVPKPNPLSCSLQVIQLPRNFITLYGNQSTDDHDNLSYEWSLSPESKDKVLEMQGVRTPILQLSAMQEGDYTFQLTVTDSAGQQDTSKVTVIVQPGQNHLKNNKPPKADAGPEKELTLPVDRTTLDGSRSSDDQKIATYHWRKTRSGVTFLVGPDGVKIENADSAIATVTGLEVGIYEFTLTVTDERKLESSDTVTVIDVLNNSDHQVVLFLGNLVVGKYSFTLTRDLVELVLEVAVSQVSQRQRDLLLRQDRLNTDVKASCPDSSSPPSSSSVCQLNCSGHGECDSFSRRCVCHSFWMENFIRAQLGDAESNCARQKPVPGPTSSALMHSDSDLDSDEGQERGHLLRPQNGSLKNGQGPPRLKKPREELL